jgi:hypothetical protein
MFFTSNNQQSGQSFTLDVKTANGLTTVSCDAVPDVAPVTDSDSRFAIQQMRRALDDHIHRGGQSGRAPLLLGGDNADD